MAVYRKDKKYTSYRCAGCGKLISKDDYENKRFWVSGNRFFHTKAEAIEKAVRKAEEMPNLRRKRRFW